MKDVFTVQTPSNSLPLVFDSPHSGTDYPRDFYYACPFHVLEKAEDKYVDELFSSAPEQGAALLIAHFPRSYIDVNRAEDDIDPELMSGLWPEEIAPTQRSHAGIGLIRRLARPGVPIYDRPLNVEEIKNRLQKYYRPYHTALEKLIEDAHYRHGHVWHINCHSMPSQSAFNPLSMMRASPFPSPDIVLGDRDGTTCDLHFTHAVRDFFKAQGFRVAINDPYKGVELVRRYASPSTGRHSLQIEICKSLYMDEDTYDKRKDFKAFKGVIDTFINFCADYMRAQKLPMAAD